MRGAGGFSAGSQGAKMRSTHRQDIVTIAVFSVASLVILAYLAFRPDNAISYELPKLAEFVEDDVTALTIDRPGGTVTLRQEAGRWLVSPGDYPADTTTIEFLLSVLSGLSIRDVVSVSDDPARYELDAARRVRVTAEGGAGVLRELDIGRRAATIGHTFVRIPGDGRILQASGELRGLFDRNVDGFRDKSVMSFDPESIHEIVVTRSGPAEAPRTVRVVRGEAGWVLVPGDEILQDGSSEIDAEGIASVLRFLGSLSAYRYRYTDASLGTPWLNVTLEGERIYTLKLYPEQSKVYPARSSESTYDFEMLLFQSSLILEPFGLK